MINETHNSNPKTTKSRRWIRFRLRTLLILIALLSVPLGWVGWEVDQRRKEKIAIAWIEELGGSVSSDDYIGERSWWEKTTDKWLGERVRMMNFVDTQVSDVSPLAELKNLEFLYLNDTKVSDLSLLAELKNLTHLWLGNTQVSDLSPLAELKNLEFLYLNGLQVSDEQVQELRQALPHCEISF